MFSYVFIEEYFEDKNCIGFVRTGDALHNGCVTVISNHEAGTDQVHSIRMNVGKANGGAVFRSFLSSEERTEIDANGWGRFSCVSGTVQVWVKIE
ncbi:hypothetical protein MPER_07371 [Moniliophthora perniciosa FA553]|nr:hypothetical protein MPER_07371 [Moniliophthora perniciosa FA553]